MDEHSYRSQTALAKKAGVDQKTISNLLNPDQRKPGKSGKLPSPTLREVEKIAAVFGFEVWELLRPAVSVPDPTVLLPEHAAA